jgi:hypothetical protein
MHLDRTLEHCRSASLRSADDGSAKSLWTARESLTANRSPWSTNTFCPFRVLPSGDPSFVVFSSLPKKNRRAFSAPLCPELSRLIRSPLAKRVASVAVSVGPSAVGNRTAPKQTSDGPDSDARAQDAQRRCSGHNSFSTRFTGTTTGTVSPRTGTSTHLCALPHCPSSLAQCFRPFLRVC